MSHLGRPDGIKMSKYSLQPVAKELSRLLELDVILLEDCVGSEVETICAGAFPGSVILLENLLFHKEEEEEITSGQQIIAESVQYFRASLSKLGDVYVNDAFQLSYSTHSSVIGVNLPVKVCGLSFKRELEFLSKILSNAEKPFLVIIGGAASSTKVRLIEAILEKASELVICGGACFSFLKSTRDMKIGKSAFDDTLFEIVPRLLEMAKTKNVSLHFPEDFVTGSAFKEDSAVGYANVSDGIKDDEVGLDIGHNSVKLFRDIILRSKTVLLLGNPGMYSWARFSTGTKELMTVLTEVTKQGALTIVSGEESARAAVQFGAKVSHVSPGEQCLCDLMDGKDLPGVAALSSASLGTS